MFEEDLHRELVTLKVSGQGILLAVSGGADSMAMLHATCRLQTRLSIERIEVAHFNHGLRGDESNADATMVHQTCEKLGIVCHTQEVLPGDLASTSSGSLEEAARKARYAFLETIAEQRNLNLIATAHHSQDQCETVLFNLLRGTGLRGLRGVPRVRQISSTIRLIRPMLHIERSSIQHWLCSEGLEYREDSSNVDMAFTRNRIRRMLAQLPTLERADLVSQLRRLSQQAETTLQCLDAAASQILDSAILDVTATTIRLSRSRLLSFPEPLVRHAINALWASANWPLQQMTREHWLRLSQMISTATPRRRMYPGAVDVQIRRDLIILTRG